LGWSSSTVGWARRSSGGASHSRLQAQTFKILAILAAKVKPPRNMVRAYCGLSALGNPIELRPLDLAAMTVT
jgi:hypothetical protein